MAGAVLRQVGAVNLQSRYDLEAEEDRLGDALDGIRPLTAAGRPAARAPPPRKS